MTFSPVGIVLCFVLLHFFPFVICIQESFMDRLLRLESGFYRLFIFFKCSEIESLSLKTDIDPVVPVLQPEYSAESACIIPPVFTVLEDLNTGSVNVVQFIC